MTKCKVLVFDGLPFLKYESNMSVKKLSTHVRIAADVLTRVTA